MTSTPRTNEADELEKIMSEIEQLQSEISDVEAAPVFGSLTAEEEDILKEIQASANFTDHSTDLAIPADMQGNMEETLAQLDEVQAPSSILEQVVATQKERNDFSKKEENAPMSNSQNSTQNSSVNGNDSGRDRDSKDGCLTLTLTGNMTLKLKYEFEGQEVTVSFADQALRVQMTDGTEFKVPVSRLAASATNTITTTNVKPIRKTG
jgi:hypothetical protein